MPHSPLNLDISLGEKDVPHIHMTITPTHFEDNKMGACWSEIDMESFLHLRRLLELHFSAEEIDREVPYLAKANK